MDVEEPTCFELLFGLTLALLVVISVALFV